MQDEDYIECRVCGVTKPIDQFPHDKKWKGSTHRKTVCNVCNHEQVKAWRAKKKAEASS